MTETVAERKRTGLGGTAAYSLTARVLHWTTAVLVLILIPLGIIIGNRLIEPWQDWLYNLHRSIGALVILVIIIRLLYRLGHAPPPLPDEMPHWQHVAAHATHWALYALLVVQPFIGWAGSSAYPAPIPVFGLFELPPIVGPNRLLSDRLLTVHMVIGIAIALLVTMHIGAALYHHFVRKDGVLLRMTTG